MLCSVGIVDQTKFGNSETSSCDSKSSSCTSSTHRLKERESVLLKYTEQYDCDKQKIRDTCRYRFIEHFV